MREGRGDLRDATAGKAGSKGLFQISQAEFNSVVMFETLMARSRDIGLTFVVGAGGGGALIGLNFSPCSLCHRYILSLFYLIA